MLPKANYSFVLPSLSDGLELHSRLYFPRRTPGTISNSVPGFAILAHPYAPLGGCFDDPTVQSVGSVLLEQGIVLCTFNFRGAINSPGSTSWTGKPELGDYVSIYTFMLHLINTPELLDHFPYDGPDDRAPFLVLGGYSYGSMIASHLPDLTSITLPHASDDEESLDRQIETRAHETAKVFMGYWEMYANPRRNSNKSQDGTSSPNSMREVTRGGYGSHSPVVRPRGESLRKAVDVERVRHGIGRVRSKLSLRATATAQQDLGDSGVLVSPSRFPVEPKVAYLLISPLLPPVAGFTTMFSKLSYERKGIGIPHRAQTSVVQNLTENSALAVYGDKDVFTSARRLKKWAEELQEVPGSHFTFEEIAGAGHFWHEDGANKQLCRTVRQWVNSLSGMGTDRIVDRTHDRF